MGIQKRRYSPEVDRLHADVERGLDEAEKYTPVFPSDWDGTPPSTIQEALDRLANHVKNGTGAVPIEEL